MTRAPIWLLACAVLLFGAQGWGADGAPKGGIFKGTVTIAGKPTADVMVSVEGVAQEQVKSQIEKSRSRPKGAEICSLRFAGAGRHHR